MFLLFFAKKIKSPPFCSFRKAGENEARGSIIVEHQSENDIFSNREVNFNAELLFGRSNFD